MKFAGHYRLPGIAMGMSGERKVFTASSCIWKAVNTFNIVFPMPQSFWFTWHLVIRHDGSLSWSAATCFYTIFIPQSQWLTW